MSANLILLVNLFCTMYMTGVIWLVQIVHYPLFREVGRDSFILYHGLHKNLISPVVGPPMLVEGVTAAMLLSMRPVGMPTWAAWTGLGLVLVQLLVTGFVSIPYHNQLAGGFDPDAYTHLVQTNWLRTIAWTARSGLMLWVLWNALQSLEKTD